MSITRKMNYTIEIDGGVPDIRKLMLERMTKNLDASMARDFFDLLNQPSADMLHAAHWASRTASSCFPRMHTLDTCTVHDAQMTLLGECVARLHDHPPEGDIEKLLAEIELRNFPIPVIATVERRRSGHGRWTVDLKFQCSVLDRDTRARTMVVIPCRFEVFDDGPPPERPMVHGTVYRTVQAMLLHELDEAWHVRGERVNDPHRNDPR